MRITAKQQGFSKTTVNNAVHLVTSKLRDSKFIKERFNPQWNGILTVDGKYIKLFDHCERKTVNYVWACGIDFSTKDLPHYFLNEDEGKIDMVMYFQELKKLNYPLKVLISDDNHEILEAARHVFGNDFRLQLCTHYYVEKIKGMSPYEDDLLVEFIKKIIYSNKKEDLYRRLIFLMNNQQKLCHKRYQKEILLDFKEHVKQLVTYIFYPDYIPRTNNEIENLFRQLNLRLKTIGRFYHHEYAADFLNGWALMRRFTSFTDCKDPNKHRNGKAPLELAGCDIKGINYLKL